MRAISTLQTRAECLFSRVFKKMSMKPLLPAWGAALLLAGAAQAQSYLPPEAAVRQAVEQSPTVQAADAAIRTQLLNDFAAKIHTPYMVIAGVLLVVAAGILFSPLPEVRAAEANAGGAGGAAEKHSIFQFPHLWLGVLCLFLYVGAEVMAGDAIGAYGNGFSLPLDALSPADCAGKIAESL